VDPRLAPRRAKRRSLVSQGVVARQVSLFFSIKNEKKIYNIFIPKRKKKHKSPHSQKTNPPKHRPILSKLALYNSRPDEAIVTEYFGNDLIPSWLFDESCSDLSYYRQGNDFAWCPIKFSDGDPDEYSIYYSCVNRIDYYERLLAFEGLPKSIIKSVRSLQDRYQALTLHMEMKHQYGNRSIRKKVSNDLVSMSPFEIYKPGIQHSFGIGELPDLFVQVIYCEFWGDHLEYPFKDPQIVKLVALLSKALPYPCKARSVNSILPNTWLDNYAKKKQKHPMVLNVVLRMVVCSLLGAYEHCRVVANFRARRKIFKWLSMNLPDEATLGRWISANKHLIIYVMREYLAFCIMGIPALNDMLSENYAWKGMLENTFSSMDEVRGHVNRILDDYATKCYAFDPTMEESTWENFLKEKGFLDAFDPNCLTDELWESKEMAEEVPDSEIQRWLPGKPWFSETSDLLANANKVNLERCHRPIDMNFLDKVVSTITTTNDENFRPSVGQKRGGTRSKKRPVTEKLRQIHAEPLSEEVRRTIDFLVDRYDEEIHGPGLFFFFHLRKKKPVISFTLNEH